jgi:hypothetical protein
MAGTTHHPDEDTSRHRTDWGRVADGVGLAGLGVFFLVATMRGLPDGFWTEAVSFWPVLLVSAGIRIVFEKTPFAAGMVLGPIVVVGTLFWLAWGAPPKPLPPGEWHELAAAKPQGSERARVRAKLAGVQLGIEARPLDATLLADGRAASREGTPRLDVDDGDDEARLRLEGRDSGFMIMGGRREVWDLGVSDALPLEFDLSGAFIRGDLDLRRGWLSGAKIEGAFNSWRFRLPPPSQPVEIRFQGAFSTFSVEVPQGTKVRYDGPGFPLVWLDDGPARDELAEDAPAYHVVLEGAFSVVNIEESPPPEGGWPPRRPVLESPEADTASGEDAATGGETQTTPTPEPTPGPPAEDPDGA